MPPSHASARLHRAIIARNQGPPQIDFLKQHYDAEGTFGLPMKDAEAKALETPLPDLACSSK
jgi:hypothetical protein